MRFCFFTTLVVYALSLCATDFASAQRGRGPASSWMGLLRMESVQSEIELVNDQQAEIEELQEEMWREMQDRMAEIRGLEPEERREKFGQLREEMDKHQVEYQTKIEGVLLPMQLKRLRELHVQSQSRREGNGAVGVLQSDDVLKELGIDKEQKQKLKDKAEEVRKELTKKIKKLRAEAEEEILSVLTSEQRKKFREKIGETFDFDNDRQPRFRRGGEDRGGRGDRGRRGGNRQERPENSDGEN